MRTLELLITGAALLVLVAVPMPAGAVEFSGGMSLGGFQAGAVPSLAVGPHMGISWRIKRDLLFEVHDLCGILPVSNDGVGVYNTTSITIGYVWGNASFSAGPSLSMYFISACTPYAGKTLCGRVAGLAPGGHAQAEVYFAGPLGMSVSGHVDWVGGSSLVLPGGLAVMVVAGPVLRWRAK